VWGLQVLWWLLFCGDLCVCVCPWLTHGPTGSVVAVIVCVCPRLTHGPTGSVVAVICVGRVCVCVCVCANLGGHGYPGAGLCECVCAWVCLCSCGRVRANLGGHGYPGAGLCVCACSSVFVWTHLFKNSCRGRCGRPLLIYLQKMWECCAICMSFSVDTLV
jgi:hypothetical protein